MEITIRELEDLTARAVKKFGYSDDETRAICEVLLYAQLRSNNQGVAKLIGKGIPRDPLAGEIVIEKETPISARINGNRNHAMVVVKKALELVIEKAKKNGFGIAGTFNTNTSSGAIGYFAAELARQGLIGFVFGRSPERVAMHGSYEPVFGTNPLAVGIPADPDPIVLDMFNGGHLLLRPGRGFHGRKRDPGRCCLRLCREADDQPQGSDSGCYPFL